MVPLEAMQTVRENPVGTIVALVAALFLMGVIAAATAFWRRTDRQMNEEDRKDS